MILEGVIGTVPYKVVTVSPDGSVDSHELVQAAFEGVMEQAVAALSSWSEDSETSRLSTSADTATWHTASEALSAALLASDLARELSNGLFDPALAAAHAAELGRPVCGASSAPTRGAGLRESFAWREAAVPAQGSGGGGLELRKLRGEAGLDCCGVAKGFACAEVVRRLRGMGLTDVLCCWGGEACAAGRHPEGRPWRLGVVRPPPPGAVFREWEAAKKAKKPLWADAGRLLPHVAEVLEVPEEGPGVLWHFAASGGWARPRQNGLTELVGSAGLLELKDVPGVALAVREAPARQRGS